MPGVPVSNPPYGTRSGFLDITGARPIMGASGRGREFPRKRQTPMFLDVKELAARKIRIRKSYAPGAVDYHTGDFRQVEPLEVRATAELIEGQIRITGELHTRIEMVCARCLEPVTEDISRDFDLFYRPLMPVNPDEEVRLKNDDTDIAFFQGEGLFLADVWAEQVLLAIPMKV